VCGPLIFDFYFVSSGSEDKLALPKGDFISIDGGPLDSGNPIEISVETADSQFVGLHMLMVDVRLAD